MNTRAGWASHRDLSDYLMLPGGWVHDAACSKWPEPDLWHPPLGNHKVGWRRERNQQEKYAIIICRDCPVRVECLTFALKLPPTESSGVWGGTTDSERAEMRKQRNVA